MVGMTFSTASSAAVVDPFVGVGVVVGPARTILLTCNDVAVSSFWGTVGRAIGSSDAFVNMGGPAVGPRTTELPETSVNENELLSKSCVVGRWTLPLSTGVALFLAVSPIINVASVPPVPSLRPINPPLPFPSTERQLYDTPTLFFLSSPAEEEEEEGGVVVVDDDVDDDDVSVKYEKAEDVPVTEEDSVSVFVSSATTGGGGGDGNG